MPAKPPRIGIITPIWKRPELTRLMLGNTAKVRRELAGRMQLVPLAAGSEGAESRELAESNDFLYLEVPNSPLGRKMNTALSLFRNLDVDGVCILGSDDLVDKSYFEALLAHLNSGHELLGTDSLYVLDQPTGRLMLWRNYFPPRNKDTCGAGRFLHRRCLERMDWRLWDDDINKWLDGSMRRRLKEAFGADADFFQMPWREFDYTVMDVKNAMVLTAFDIVAASGPGVFIGNPHRLIAERFSPEIADALLPPGTPRLNGEDISLPVPLQPMPPVRAFKNALFLSEWKPPEESVTLTQDGVFFETLRLAGVDARMLAVADGQSAGLTAAIPDVVIVNAQTRLSLADCNRLFRQNRLLRQQQQPDGTLLIDCRQSDPQTVLELADQDFWLLCDEKAALPASLHDHPRLLKAPRYAVLSPARVPGYEQRGNLFALVRETTDLLQLHTTWLDAGASCKVFMSNVGSPDNKQFQHLGIFEMEDIQAPVWRQHLRVGILAFHQQAMDFCLQMLAGGMPLVCHRAWAREHALGPEQGVFPARDYAEALRLALRLHEQKTLWEAASRSAVAYARRCWPPERLVKALNMITF